jgi:hypothetical protein
MPQGSQGRLIQAITYLALRVLADLLLPWFLALGSALVEPHQSLA